MLVVIPEGLELAGGEEEHGGDEALAGSVALVLLEFEHGDITDVQAIEEIEALLGGHDEHEDEGHSAQEDSGEESLSDSILHAITEYEEGTITAQVALSEIESEISTHSHAEEEHEGHANGLILGGAILAGFLLMLILEGSGIGHAVHEEHHEHEADHGHEHLHHGGSGMLLVFGMTLHAATDGLAIGAAAATGSASITAAVVVAVLIHKAPAAFSLGVFSMHERTERIESIKDVTIFSLATPVLMMIAFYALAGLEATMIGIAMLFSAGTFLYVATVDTLPDMHNPATGKKAMMYVIVGVLLMVALLVGADASGLLAHGH